jgi:hypothetical protein
MEYNAYVRTISETYNIKHITETNLAKLIDTYNLGKDSVFLNGKKYELASLEEIKIYTLDNPEGFNDFINTPEIKNELKWSKYGIWFSAHILAKCGTNVTDQFITDDFGHSKSTQIPLETLMDIFISHSSEDAQMAKMIVELIRAAYNIPADKIRCTSVNGYKLPAGASTESQLKQEIHHSKVLLAIITPHSIGSAYVLFELGARWGLSLPLIPLVTSEQGMALLKGPLGNINALVSHDAAQLHQLLDDLGTYLNITKQSPSVYEHLIQEIVVQSLKDVLPKQAPASKPTLTNEYDDALTVIKEHAKTQFPTDYSMQSFVIKEQKAAVEDLKKGNLKNIPADVFLQIRQFAASQFPTDFGMRLFSEKEQIDAYIELNAS